MDYKDESDDYSDEYIDDNNSIVNSDKTKSINESVNESLPEELSKSKAPEIDEQMGTFHSKEDNTGRSMVKSDDYENDFEEEPISDQVS